MISYCSGHCETHEKQVAMIAQKIVDAKHTEQKRRALIAFTNARTATLWAFLQNHDPQLP
jgi:hypothetical protein